MNPNENNKYSGIEIIKLDPNDEKYMEGIKYAIELNKKIANIIGIWPTVFLQENSEKSKLNFEIIVKRIKNGLFYFLLLFLLVPGILHIVLEERTLKRRILKVRTHFFKSSSIIYFFLSNPFKSEFF